MFDQPPSLRLGNLVIRAKQIKAAMYSTVATYHISGVVARHSRFPLLRSEGLSASKITNLSKRAKV